MKHKLLLTVLLSVIGASAQITPPPNGGGGGGSGTVTSVSVVTANGVSGTVATPTVTPAITLILGAITPASTNGVSATTMSYLDATSSVQTQLNSKASATTPVTGGTCTNQVVTALTVLAVPTCTTITSSYVNNTIALTGTDINTSNQVTVTHLASALPAAQGGTGITSFGTGVATALGTNVSGSGAICLASGSLCGSGSTPAFSSLTSGTNTTAAMVVGTGGSIGVSGSGTNAATSAPISGITGLGTGVATALGTAVSGSGAVCLASGSTCNTGVGTVNTVASGAAPAFNLALGSIQYVSALATNATATISNIAVGSWIFTICNNGTGGYTWTWPASVHGGMSIGTIALTCSTQTFVSKDGTTLYAVNAGTINQ